ncbi:MAG TPA: alginate export family protein [Tepidisphaeraceae bacterium]|nr:alginate export family protein [Tepidisphaeraceae bacterium]
MKGLIIVVLIIVIVAGAAFGQSSPPPASKPPSYTLSRWDEDYRYLKDGKGNDIFDPIKYIRLNDAGDWYLSLGAQARYRYEFFDNNNFGAGVQDDNGFHLLRVLAHADLHLGDNFRLFFQVKSALIEGRDGGPRPTDADEADIQQAFGDLTIPFAEKSSAMVRVGRQDLAYGAQRLISPLDWTNVRRTFEGVRGSLKFSGQTLDLFWVRPVIVDKDELNQGDDDTSFAGIYDVITLPTLIQNANSRLDVYFLALNKDNNATTPVESDTYTIGTRFWTNPKPWDVDVEADYQFGEFGTGDISAWSFAIEGGYTFANTSMSPRVHLGFDIASGDDDPTDPDRQTFNQLFPLGHLYFGFIDVIGRQNIIDLHPGVTLKLTPQLTFRGDYHIFWRQSSSDAMYAASGAPLIAAGASSDKFIGQEADLLLTWQVDRHFQVYGGYSHFFAGDFVEESGAATGADEDIDFLYAALVYTL